VVLLASARTSNVTGANYVIDGGLIKDDLIGDAVTVASLTVRSQLFARGGCGPFGRSGGRSGASSTSAHADVVPPGCAVAAVATAALAADAAWIESVRGALTARSPRIRSAIVWPYGANFAAWVSRARGNG